jgi:hypothetical protein
MIVNDVKQFDCAGVEWAVVVSDEAIAERASSVPGSQDHGRIAGLTDCFAGTVIIASGQSESQKRNTLWHEIWHASFEAVGGMRMPSGEGHPSEDDVILQLSSILLDVMRRNGPLASALLAGSPAFHYIGEEHAAR